MTVRQCKERFGHSERMCEAFVKAGLTVNQVTPRAVADLRGFTQAEHKALDDHYRTKLEPQECDALCTACHPELLRQKR